jgi:hypothetical protein
MANQLKSTKQKAGSRKERRAEHRKKPEPRKAPRTVRPVPRPRDDEDSENTGIPGAQRPPADS